MHTRRLYAHRGASAERPENTMVAFQRAVEIGVDALELDVHLTRDKVLIVSIYVALGITGALPAWLVILVVSRDIMIVGAVILSWVVDHPVAMKPLLVSKLNTAAQIVFATLKLASLALGFSAEPALTVALGLVVVLTLLSIGFYLRGWMRHMNSAEAGN